MSYFRKFLYFRAVGRPSRGRPTEFQPLKSAQHGKLSENRSRQTGKIQQGGVCQPDE